MCEHQGSIFIKNSILKSKNTRVKNIIITKYHQTNDVREEVTKAS